MPEGVIQFLGGYFPASELVEGALSILVGHPFDALFLHPAGGYQKPGVSQDPEGGYLRHSFNVVGVLPEVQILIKALHLFMMFF